MSYARRRTPLAWFLPAFAGLLLGHQGIAGAADFKFAFGAGETASGHTQVFPTMVGLSTTTVNPEADRSRYECNGFVL